MAEAGYSGTPLARKLGIAPGTCVVAFDAPANYARLIAPVPDGARIVSKAPASPEFVHLFTTSRARLAARLRALRKTLAPDGVVWVSWPKKSAKVTTDVTEDVVRDVALPLQFVDVKVCAVDETWSGLKLVIRKAARHTRP